MSRRIGKQTVRARCVEAGRKLTLGKTYAVRRYYQGMSCSYIWALNDAGIWAEYYAERFVEAGDDWDE